MKGIWDYYDFIAAVDPGLSHTGATGVIVLTERGILDGFLVRGKKGEGYAERLARMKRDLFADLYRIIGRDLRVLFSVEMNHATENRSADSALRQFGLIGALIAQAHEQEYDVVEVRPSQGKKALTGNGWADKDEDMVPAAEAFAGWRPEWSRFKYSRQALADALGAAIAGAEKVLQGADSK